MCDSRDWQIRWHMNKTNLWWKLMWWARIPRSVLCRQNWLFGSDLSFYHSQLWWATSAYDKAHFVAANLNTSCGELFEQRFKYSVKCGGVRNGETDDFSCLNSQFGCDMSKIIFLESKKNEIVVIDCWMEIDDYHVHFFVIHRSKKRELIRFILIKPKRQTQNPNQLISQPFWWAQLGNFYERDDTRRAL